MTDSQKVVGRFKKQSMAVILRNVVKHDWGFFSEEDERMHLQTAEKGARTGKNKIKIWLETRGKRTIERATENFSGADFKKLAEQITQERKTIEDKWVVLMLKKGWLKAEIKGSVITLTAYPNSHNKYTRRIDLRKELPGAYVTHPSWDTVLVHAALQQDVCALAVGPEKNLDERVHFYLPKIIFTD